MRISLLPPKLPERRSRRASFPLAPFANRRPSAVALFSLVALLATTLAAHASPLPDEAKPTLEITSVSVSPDPLAPDTLCSLAVEISNPGSEPASQLAFEVRVAGHELPVYRNQIFMQALPPGETTRVELYNFWTTETARPAPKGDKFTVEVVLREAQWYRIGDIEEEGKTVEEWTPLGAVPGLPKTREKALPWKAGSASKSPASQ